MSHLIHDRAGHLIDVDDQAPRHVPTVPTHQTIRGDPTRENLTPAWAVRLFYGFLLLVVLGLAWGLLHASPGFYAVMRGGKP